VLPGCPGKRSGRNAPGSGWASSRQGRRYEAGEADLLVDGLVDWVKHGAEETEPLGAVRTGDRESHEPAPPPR